MPKHIHKLYLAYLLTLYMHAKSKYKDIPIYGYSLCTFIYTLGHYSTLIKDTRTRALYIHV